MKISSVKVKLSNEDILTIVDQFVKVPGLSIEEIEIKDIIYIKGSYKKAVKIPFKAKVGIGSIKDNTLILKVLGVKVYNIPIFRGIIKYALKTFLKDLKEQGISSNGDNILLDFHVLSKLIPNFCFNLTSILLLNNEIEVKANQIIYTENSNDKIEDMKKEEVVYKKYTDWYTSVRKSLLDAVPKKYDEVLDYALIVPDFLALLWRLMKDKRVKISTKILIGSSILYTALPEDFIPDSIPFVGEIDDVVVLMFLLDKIVNTVPEHIIYENWQGKEDIFIKVKEGVNFANRFIGSKNISGFLALTGGFLSGINKKGKK